MLTKLIACCSKKIDNFTLTVQTIEGTDKYIIKDSDNNTVETFMFYAIVNPQNLSVFGKNVSTVTGKLTIDATEASHGSVSLSDQDYFHIMIDTCGMHMMKDTANDSIDGYTYIRKTFPEHQLNNILTACTDVMWIYRDYQCYEYVNFGGFCQHGTYGYDYTPYYPSMIINGDRYIIIGIKEISSPYDGYASESYFDKDDGTYLLLVNYDNNGYGQTYRTTITAWVVEIQPQSPTM